LAILLSASPILHNDSDQGRILSTEDTRKSGGLSQWKAGERSEPDSMKIDLAEPQPADFHLFEARVNE
jgi:hypothetical protein